MAVHVAGATSLIQFVASLVVLSAEREAMSATITTFGDAMWWAFTTIATVSYGDRYSITAQAWFIAAALMVAGIAQLGTITGSPVMNVGGFLCDMGGSGLSVRR